MVSESVIDQVAIELDEASDNVTAAVEALQELSPSIVAFLGQDSTKLLTAEEYSLLWYMVLVIVRSWQQTHGTLPVLEPDQLGQQEEELWEWYEADVKQPFAHRLDRFFASCKEEDLLAFVEDMTVPDEDNIVSEAGRPLLVIMAATVIFALAK